MPTSVGSQKNEGNSKKTSASLNVLKSLIVWITTKCENSSRDGNTRPLYTPLTNLYAGQEATVRTGHGKKDWFQIEKGVCHGCILSPCLLHKSTTCKMPGWIKHKLESRLLGEISITSGIQMIPCLWQKVKSN